MFQVGQVTPIRPRLAHRPEEVTDAFRYLQNGEHIGKVILEIKDSTISGVRSAPKLALDPNASYSGWRVGRFWPLNDDMHARTWRSKHDFPLWKRGWQFK